MGTQGSAAHNFKQIGVIRIDINEIKDDKIFELAIEAGADECFSLENFHEIHCGSEDIYSIKKKLSPMLRILYPQILSGFHSTRFPAKVRIKKT